MRQCARIPSNFAHVKVLILRFASPAGRYVSFAFRHAARRPVFFVDLQLCDPRAVEGERLEYWGLYECVRAGCVFWCSGCIAHPHSFAGAFALLISRLKQDKRWLLPPSRVNETSLVRICTVARMVGCRIEHCQIHEPGHAAGVNTNLTTKSCRK